MLSQSLKPSSLSLSLLDSIRPHPGSTDELPCSSFGVMLAVIGTPVSSLSKEYERGSIVGNGVVGFCSCISMCCMVGELPLSVVSVSSLCLLYFSLSSFCCVSLLSSFSCSAFVPSLSVVVSWLVSPQVIVWGSAGRGSRVMTTERTVCENSIAASSMRMFWMACLWVLGVFNFSSAIRL